MPVEEVKLPSRIGTPRMIACKWLVIPMYVLEVNPQAFLRLRHKVALFAPEVVLGKVVGSHVPRQIGLAIIRGDADIAGEGWVVGDVAEVLVQLGELHHASFAADAVHLAQGKVHFFLVLSLIHI